MLQVIPALFGLVENLVIKNLILAIIDGLIEQNLRKRPIASTESEAALLGQIARLLCEHYQPIAFADGVDSQLASSRYSTGLSLLEELGGYENYDYIKSCRRFFKPDSNPNKRYKLERHLLTHPDFADEALDIILSLRLTGGELLSRDLLIESIFSSENAIKISTQATRKLCTRILAGEIFASDQKKAKLQLRLAKRWLKANRMN